MKSAITLLARRALSTATLRQAVPRATFPAIAIQTSRRLSTEKVVEHVPPEDYYEGHLMADHLEYLDDMMDVVLNMEEAMTELQDIYDEKRSALEDLSETVTLDALFEKSAAQKSLLSSQIADLKAVVANAKAFATDGPDGTSDAAVMDGIKEVNRIIDSASKNEDTDSVRIQHAFGRATNKARARDPEHDW